MATNATPPPVAAPAQPAAVGSPADAADSPINAARLHADAARWEVEVFFDGDCPLCKREISMLRRWDKRRVVRFTDIAAADFDAASVGVPFDKLMAEIHGRLPDGQIIVGVEVFRRLYAAVGMGWLVAPTRLPGIRHGLDAAYRLFAKYRLPAGRLLAGNRCKESCEAPGAKAAARPTND